MSNQVKRSPKRTTTIQARQKKPKVNLSAIAAATGAVAFTGLTAAFLVKMLKHPPFTTSEQELKFYLKTLETCKTEYFLLERRYQKELSEMIKNVGKTRQQGGKSYRPQVTSSFSGRPETFKEFLSRKLRKNTNDPNYTWDTINILKNQIDRCKTDTFNLIQKHTREMQDLQRFLNNAKR